MDIVFDKNIEISSIEDFENCSLEKVCNSAIFMLLKRELIEKKFSFEIKVQHTEPDLRKYCSHLVMDIFDDKGERVCEPDEPNCCLMLCETICFTRNRHIIGIDLLTDKEFLESLKLLIEQVKEYD